MSTRVLSPNPPGPDRAVMVLQSHLAPKLTSSPLERSEEAIAFLLANQHLLPLPPWQPLSVFSLVDSQAELIDSLGNISFSAPGSNAKPTHLGPSRLQENNKKSKLYNIRGIRNTCITSRSFSIRVCAPSHCGNPGTPEVGMSMRARAIDGLLQGGQAVLGRSCLQ